MITFRVPDMTCGHCARNITKALAGVDPQALVEFDIGAHLVRVLPASASAATLQSAIGEAGYTASLVDAPAAPATRRSVGCGCGCGPGKAVDTRQAAPARAGGCCS